jgi:hypothetical protein
MNRIALAFFFALWNVAVSAQAPMVPNSGAPVFGFSLLAKSGTSAAVTGTAAETVLATISIPANTIGPNGQMKINAYWTTTSSANNKTIRVRLGGLSGSVIFSAVPTTVANVWSSTILNDANSTSSQFMISEVARGTDSLVATVSATSAVDMTSSQSLVITGQLSTTSETITLNGYTVEYAP